MSDSIWSESPIGHIQDLSTEIINQASSLSKRGKDAFRSLFVHCNENVATLAYTLLAGNYSWDTFRSGIGGKTFDELKGFSTDILELIRKHKDVPGLEEWDIFEKKARLIPYGIPRIDIDGLLQLELSLGHFPVAAFASAWFSSRNERDGYIYRHGLSIWLDTKENSLAELADHLNLSPERCRQIRQNLLGELNLLLDRIVLPAPCPYDYLSKDLDCVVNEKEGTAFSIDFIRFLFGSTYTDLSVVGKTDDSFVVKLKGGENDAFVAAIPDSLAKAFDFNAFLSEISSINGEKRTDSRLLPLPDWDQDARNLAAILAGLRYGWTAENGSLVIPPNSDKNRSDIMEDIIRDAGHPLSVDEIEKEYARRYPDRITDRSKIRGNMQSNPRIVPIGRSGVYSLAEWTTGSARGGTIRSFVRECLDNSETHIVPTEKVFGYVRLFRPTSSDENIITNLMLETEKSFRIIWKDGISYLSYSSENIPDGYKQIIRTISERRSFEESIALLDEFITRYGRFPKVCEDPEQTRIARFLSIQRSLRRRGMLDVAESDELRRIESRLSDGAVQLELF